MINGIAHIPEHALDEYRAKASQRISIKQQLLGLFALWARPPHLGGTGLIRMPTRCEHGPSVGQSPGGKPIGKVGTSRSSGGTS
jgi:hypothetical protein